MTFACLGDFSVKNVRNIAKCQLTLDSQITLITGHNGAGKTSLLEALYFLITGYSFRGGGWQKLLKHDSNVLEVYLTYFDEPMQMHRLGLEKSHQHGSRMKLNGQWVQSRSDIAGNLPVQVIAPDVESVVDGSADTRRKFLDWGVFFSEPSYLGMWKRNKQILLQRNALLKHKSNANQLKSWNQLWVESCETVSAFRQQYLECLHPIWTSVLDSVEGGRDYQLKLFPGWQQGTSLIHVIEEDYEQEKKMGYTRFGSHRADLRILYKGRVVKNELSRGYRKLLNIQLRLAQMVLLYQQKQQKTLCLIDDLTAELDVNHREQVYKLMNKVNAQMVITGLFEDPALETAFNKDVINRFHVKQGIVSAVDPDVERSVDKC